MAKNMAKPKIAWANDGFWRYCAIILFAQVVIGYFVNDHKFGQGRWLEPHNRQDRERTKLMSRGISIPSNARAYEMNAWNPTTLLPVFQKGVTSECDIIIYTPGVYTFLVPYVNRDGSAKQEGPFEVTDPPFTYRVGSLGKDESVVKMSVTRVPSNVVHLDIKHVDCVKHGLHKTK